VKKYLHYIKENYVGSNYEPPHKHCNLHNRVKQGIPGTNNSVEGWNRRMNELPESAHLPLWNARILCLVGNYAEIELPDFDFVKF